MRRRTAVLGILVAAVAAEGCGGGDVGPDARTDAGAFADAPVTGTCDYTERDDAGNAATAEVTGLTLGDADLTICGMVDRGHFATGLVDDDAFAVTVGAAGADLIVRLTGTGAADLGQLVVEVQDAQGSHGYAVYVVDHGVMTTHLAAGAYVVVVEAHATEDVATAIPYRVAIAADSPATRCPRVTATASHVETDESNAQPPDTADDVIFIDSVTSEKLTPSTTDAPDDSKVVVTAGKAYRITGDSANVNLAPPDGDAYHDRDTFLISTGADTNELELRLDWTGATNDLDLFLFPEVPDGHTPADIGSAQTSNPEERQTIAVAPSSRYWLWIGGYDMSKALPATYDVSICGTHYAP